MKNVKQLMLLFFFCSMSAVSISQTFFVNDIGYSITSASPPLTVQLWGGWSASGIFVIPEIVNYNGEDYAVTSIEYEAFYGASALTSVVIPNSVTSIGEGAFGSCYSLTSVTIPNSVTSIGPVAFAGCISLTSVTIPNSVTSIGLEAFMDCISLNSMVLPNSMTTIADGLFLNCWSLNSLVIPNSLSSIGSYVFIGCISLTSIEIPNSVTSIGYGAFYESGLINIAIPNSVSSIGEYAFENCYDLSSVTVNWPNPLTINANVFYDLTLGNITLNVPIGTQSLYQAASVWQDFNPIQEQTCSTVEGTDIISSCSPITWIDGNTYTENNNTATHLLEGAAQNGCDSLVTLNFTLWPCTQLQPSSCNATNVQMTNVLGAIAVPEHGGYRFRIVGANNGGAGWNGNTFILDRPVRNFRFSHVPGSLWGESYTVEVAVGDGNGNYGPYGVACDVTLANLPTTTQLQNSQCGISDVSQSTFLFANQVNNAAGYRFRILGANNGAQGWSGNTYILDRPTRDFKFSMVPGVIWGETYSIEVAVLSTDNVTYGEYGTACNVTLQATPTTALQTSQCGITNVAQNTSLFANAVSGAAGYRFRVVGANNGATGWVVDTYILDRPVRNFKFNMIPGVLQGEDYEVQVAVLNADGNYGAYGMVCSVELEGAPDFVINDENEIFLTDKTMNVVEFGASASHNPFTTDFGIQVLNANDTDAIIVTVYDMSGKLIERNAVNPMDIESARFGANLATGMYMIEVKQGTNQAMIRQVKN